MNRFVHAAAAALDGRATPGLLHGLVWDALAQVLDYEDRCAEAETYYLRALDVYQRELEPDHPLLLSMLHVVKTFYASLGRHEEAGVMGKRFAVALSAPEWAGATGPVVIQSKGQSNARHRSRFTRIHFLPRKLRGDAHQRVNEFSSRHSELAHYYHDRGWLDQAVEAYMQALEWERFSFDISSRARRLSYLHGLAQALREMDREEEAAVADKAAAPLRKELDRHQRDLRSDDVFVRASALHREGLMYEEQADFVRAAEAYRQGLLCETEDRHTWYFLHNNLGYCYVQLERFEEAERLCRRAIKIDPGQPNAHKNLGLALEGQGRWQEAAGHFVESVKVSDGGDPRGMFLLRALLDRHPELEQQLPDIRQELATCERLARESTEQILQRFKKKAPR